MLGGSDTCHPNETGSYALGDYIANCLVGGINNILFLEDETLLDGGYGLGYAYLDNHNVYLKFKQGTFTKSFSIGYDFTKIATLSNMFCYGCSELTDCSFMKECYITYNGGSFVKENIRFSLKHEDDGTVGLYACSISVKDNNFFDYPNVTAIGFTDELITLPIFTA
jgi:hypothetical protein